MLLALSDTAGLVLLILGGIFVVAAAGALFLRSRSRREPTPDIPRGMRPGPSDPALETPLLQKMERQGLVTRARDAQDNRVVRISLTASGRALKRKALNIPKALVCHFGLTLPAIAQLRSQLNGLTQQLRAATTGSNCTTGETS